jgi:hypothetical protein
MKMSTQPKEQEYVYQVDQQVSVNAFFDASIDAETVRFQVTSRYGSTPEKIVKTTEAAIEAYKLLRAAYPLPAAPAKTAAPASSPAAPPAPPAPATQKANVDTGVNTMAIKKMTVAPQADGKVKIGLYADGHKFPDLYMSLGLDATLKTLAGTGLEWTAEHLSAVAEFNVDFLADWRNSDKLNGKGNPYKNVIALRSTEEALPF